MIHLSTSFEKSLKDDYYYDIDPFTVEVNQIIKFTILEKMDHIEIANLLHKSIDEIMISKMDFCLSLFNNGRRDRLLTIKEHAYIFDIVYKDLFEHICYEAMRRYSLFQDSSEHIHGLSFTDCLLVYGIPKSSWIRMVNREKGNLYIIII